jgi:TrpR-related protein YerC/YecD
MMDLCTPKEIKALEERWEVAKLLASKKYTYREIAEKLGASTTTVTRVARFLFNEKNNGYKSVIKKYER